ncbi:MAG: putative Ig domain-containing protein [Chloroflexota bacterium]
MDLQLETKRASQLALIFIASLLCVSAAAQAHTPPLASVKNNIPAVKNGSFESDSIGNNQASLVDWDITTGDVDVLDSNLNKLGATIDAADGSRFIDLANATITQEISGFTPNQPYVLRIDYWGYHGFDGPLYDAQVLIDGVPLRQGLFGGDEPGIHSKEEHDWIVCNGFEFIPSSSTVELTIESEESGSNGLFLDNIRIIPGSITQPTAHDFASLTVDDNGWRRLANWSFEDSPITHSSDPENTGPDDNNPHLCGNAIPGWRVTRENTDRIQLNGWNQPHGSQVMDVGGHGPGGIAQTISGLIPNATYSLEFYAARHAFWGDQDMVTHLWSNEEFKLEIRRADDQDATDGPYIREEINLQSNEHGEITFELFSTNVDKGGNNVFDAFRIKKQQDPPFWIQQGNQLSNLGETVSFDLQATDYDNDDLTFGASQLPQGLTLNTETGEISGTPTQTGTFEVMVSVTDGNTPQVLDRFDWVINAPPQVAEIEDRLTQQDVPDTFFVQAFDPEGQVLTFAADNLPDGLSINSSTGEIAGTPSAFGSTIVTVTATDSVSATNSTAFTWIVNAGPTASPVIHQSTEKDTAVSLQIEASDPENDPLLFAGDSLPTGLTINSTTGEITGTPTSVDLFNVEITISDENGGTTKISFDWEITARMPTPTPTPDPTAGNPKNQIFLPYISTP